MLQKAQAVLSFLALLPALRKEPGREGELFTEETTLAGKYKIFRRGAMLPLTCAFRVSDFETQRHRELRA